MYTVCVIRNHLVLVRYCIGPGCGVWPPRRARACSGSCSRRPRAARHPAPPESDEIFGRSDRVHTAHPAHCHGTHHGTPMLIRASAERTNHNTESRPTYTRSRSIDVPGAGKSNGAHVPSGSARCSHACCCCGGVAAGGAGCRSASARASHAASCGQPFAHRPVAHATQHVSKGRGPRLPW